MSKKKSELILPDSVKEDNIIPFPTEQPLLKTDWATPDEDWLWQLPIGTVFLVSPKPEKDQYGRNHYSPAATEFHVDQKQEGKRRFVKLFTNLNQDQWMWVDSLYFSRGFDFGCIIYIRKEDE